VGGVENALEQNKRKPKETKEKEKKKKKREKRKEKREKRKGAAWPFEVRALNYYVTADRAATC
jgi:hypothetical protein